MRADCVIALGSSRRQSDYEALENGSRIALLIEKMESAFRNTTTIRSIRQSVTKAAQAFTRALANHQEADIAAAHYVDCLARYRAALYAEFNLKERGCRIWN